MTRKTNRRNGKEYHYYYCPTGKKKGCSHPIMVEEQKLIACVRTALKAHIDNVASLEDILSGVNQQKINQALAKEYSSHITENERRLEKVSEFKARLYESLVSGIVSREDYTAFKAKYTRQAEEIRKSIQVLKEKLEDVLNNQSERNRWIAHFTKFSSLETLDQKAVVQLIQSIRVTGKVELEITFAYKDEYDKALELMKRANLRKAG